MPERPLPAHLERQSQAVDQFVKDAAERGCRVIHSDVGGTCLDQQDSAIAHRDHGVQTRPRARWGSEDSSGAWRDRVAAGEGLCRGCRAVRALEGDYYKPGPKKWHA